MMAYSDYGGYAYRNGERIVERSDAFFSPEGIKSTPGMWPGWAMPEGRGGNSYHVILGDGPVHVCLYKQSSIQVFVNGDEVPIDELFDRKYPDSVTKYTNSDGVEVGYLDPHNLAWTGETYQLDVEGHSIEVHWTYDDNFYIYARLTQPDGTVWSGFSGYGVGAGLESAGYGYSTGERIEDMQKHWRD